MFCRTQVYILMPAKEHVHWDCALIDNGRNTENKHENVHRIMSTMQESRVFAFSLLVQLI